MTADRLLSETPARMERLTPERVRRETADEYHNPFYEPRSGQRRASWLEITPAMREGGLNTYPPPSVADIRIEPHGRMGRRR